MRVIGPIEGVDAYFYACRSGGTPKINLSNATRAAFLARNCPTSRRSGRAGGKFALAPLALNGQEAPEAVIAAERQEIKERAARRGF